MGSRDHGMVEFGVQIPMAPFDSAEYGLTHGRPLSRLPPLSRVIFDFIVKSTPDWHPLLTAAHVWGIRPDDVAADAIGAALLSRSEYTHRDELKSSKLRHE